MMGQISKEWGGKTMQVIQEESLCVCEVVALVRNEEKGTFSVVFLTICIKTLRNVDDIFL